MTAVETLRRVPAGGRVASTARCRMPEAPALACAPSFMSKGEVQRASSSTSSEMFCFQIKRTESDSSSETAEIAALQDLLFHQLTGIARFTARLREVDQQNDEIDTFVLQALSLTTPTHSSTDVKQISGYCDTADFYLKRAQRLYIAEGCPENISSAEYALPRAGNRSTATLVSLGAERNLSRRRQDIGEEFADLIVAIQNGVKGAAIYHIGSNAKPTAQVITAVTKALDLIAETLADGYEESDLRATALAVGGATFSIW